MLFFRYIISYILTLLSYFSKKKKVCCVFINNFFYDINSLTILVFFFTKKFGFILGNVIVPSKCFEIVKGL